MSSNGNYSDFYAGEVSRRSNLSHILIISLNSILYVKDSFKRQCYLAFFPTIWWDSSVLLKVISMFCYQKCYQQSGSLNILQKYFPNLVLCVQIYTYFMWLRMILQTIKDLHNQHCVPEIHLLLILKIVMLKMVMLMPLTFSKLSYDVRTACAGLFTTQKTSYFCHHPITFKKRSDRFKYSAYLIPDWEPNFCAAR